MIHLAADIGASSGRLLAGVFDGQTLEIQELHRFGNRPIAVGDHLHWDLLGLWNQIQEGLRTAAHQYSDREISSIGVDTWGVDFGLVGPGDELLGNPYSYRDRRTSGIMSRAFNVVSAEEIFLETGIQFMELNSIFQLIAWRDSGSPLLEIAEHLLLMPDLFHWLMTGEKSVELTNATTTQCYNPTTGHWAKGLIDRFGLPTKFFGTIVPPGTRLGKLRKNVASMVGLPDVEVILPGSHDTASAVMAVPADTYIGQPQWCYISSGTWSLMGVEWPQPIITDSCRELNFTNEGGVGGTTRLLKNIAGLWLVQECQRIWSELGRDYSWDELVQLANLAAPMVSLIAPNESCFTSPADMPRTICEYCRQTGQTVPSSEGAVIRCVLESLALEYRRVLRALEHLTGEPLKTIHIVGGGTQNRMLCQMTADACNRRVLAGPVEATAIGNIMMQAIALGQLDSIADARQVIRASFVVEEYTPGETMAWDEAFDRFVALSVT